MQSRHRAANSEISDLERAHLIAAFVTVAEKMSFAKAGEVLNLAPSTLSRKVSRLEELLDTRLLERTTRRVVFTELGEIYYEECRAVLAQLRAAGDRVASYHSEPQGLLRVSFPVAFGHLALAGIIADFIATYPRVQVEANYTDRFVDLLAEGYNLVVRIGSLPDSSLVARKIGTNDKFLVASPEYIAQYGQPTHPQDLANHHCLCFSRYARSGTSWQFRRGDTVETVQVQGDYRSDSSEAIFETAQHGAGIAIIARYICQEAIAAGRLVPVLPDWKICPETSFYVCYASNKHLLPKTRAFSDFLVQRLRHTLRPRRT